MPEKLETRLTPEREAKFRRWYRAYANALDLNLDPDHPLQQYDYRAAYLAGARPNAEGHWPSMFKLAGHPNRYVDGHDTIIESMREAEKAKK